MSDTMHGQVRGRLVAGESPAQIAADLGWDTADDSRADDDSWEGLAVVLPGWVADDGYREVEYPDATSGEDAAREYVRDSDWGESSETWWHDVRVWCIALYVEDGEVVEARIDLDSHSIEVEPAEPLCEREHEHDWCSPHSVVGGLRENPGVQGHGGGVIVEEVCRHCARYRITDTWAQDHETGRQGLTSVRYREADELSQEWSDAQRADAEVE